MRVCVCVFYIFFCTPPPPSCSLVCARVRRKLHNSRIELKRKRNETKRKLTVKCEKSEKSNTLRMCLLNAVRFFSSFFFSCSCCCWSFLFVNCAKINLGNSNILPKWKGAGTFTSMCFRQVNKIKTCSSFIHTHSQSQLYVYVCVCGKRG